MKLRQVSVVRSPTDNGTTTESLSNGMPLMNLEIPSDDVTIDKSYRQAETLPMPGKQSNEATSRAMAERGRQMALNRLRLQQQQHNNDKRSHRRLVLKSGDCNVTPRNVTKRNRKFIVDLFTTLVDMRWRWHVVTFVAIFLGTWTAFGGLWLAVSMATMISLDHPQTGNETALVVPCVENVNNFLSALMFSVETQSTTGYGHRYTESCVSSLFLLMLQTCVGLFIQCLATGIIFVKISRPKGRSRTILFSDKAVICKRDGRYCLLFRVGDLRRSHMVGTSLRALMIRNRLTGEGESIPLCHYPVELETETTRSDGFIFLKWPVTVVHWIKDDSSPLWDLSAEDLLGAVHFEIIVVMEGTIESTGMLTQVRTSYIPSEILWGSRLTPLVTYERQNGHYEIDYENFHKTLPCHSMPDCSARQWTELTRSHRQQSHQPCPVPPVMRSPSPITTNFSRFEQGRATGDGGLRLMTSPSVEGESRPVLADNINDYPVSFTAPAVKLHLTTAPETVQQSGRRLPLGHLFRKKSRRLKVEVLTQIVT